MLKILLTGGPSTGKSSVKKAINVCFSELGYHVILLPEISTMFIDSGIKPFGDDALPSLEYQKLVIKHQLYMEKLALDAAKLLGEDKTIIVCDRGTLDGIAYVDSEEWEATLESQNVKSRDLLMFYDAILYMEGIKEIFTTENNPSRYEKSADEALEKGLKLLKAYLGHDNFRVIQPREDIKDKETEVNNIIANMLGLPTRIRNQRKFLVESVDLDQVKSIANKVTITQDYLKCDNGVEERVRKEEQDGVYSYHFGIIKKCEDGKREILKDDVIDKNVYENLLATKQDEFGTIIKDRYFFVYNQQYFKLDVYEDGKCLLEVNLTVENPNLEFPDFVKVAADVTNIELYKNINIARRIKREEKENLRKIKKM